MEETEEVAGEDCSKRIFGRTSSQNSEKENGYQKDPEKFRVLSVDKLTVEKVVLESNGSREVFLTKNESSRKLSIESAAGERNLKKSKDERTESTVKSRYRVTQPVDTFASKSGSNFNGNIFKGVRSRLPIFKARKSNQLIPRHVDKRIKPIKLIKSPSIRSIAVSGWKWGTPNDPSDSSGASSVRKETIGICGEEGVSVAAEADEGKIIGETENGKIDDAAGDGIEKTGALGDCKDGEVGKDAQDRLEKSQCNIEVLQQNLGTKINASTAQKYKEKLLDLGAKRVSKLPTAVDSKLSERIVTDIAFDRDFLERHNLDKRLKIEESRLLETDLDYVSDAEQNEEPSHDGTVAKTSARPSYSQKVSEVEKRWSGEFLESRLETIGSSGSSESSYVEEFGSVSSRESVLEDRTGRLTFQGKHPSTSENTIDGTERRTSEEILDDSTVSTVDSGSCLEDRIKAVDADIEETISTIQEDEGGNDDDTNEHVSEIRDDQRSFEDLSASGAEDDRTLNSSDETHTGSTEVHGSAVFPPRSHSKSSEDGYANLIREFTMEGTGPPRAKKEDKQKKKLGFRRLLPGFFSPKDSRKDYKKKDSKETKELRERKRHDEKHFARYQQNGNYTISPDTMNLNEDIKRNVKLDNSLNGSIIEERLDEIKRELFPDQGPITSTPDHLAREEDRQHGRDHRVCPGRSYTTDSSLSSIAPIDDRWNERNVRNVRDAGDVRLGVTRDVGKYEERQKREEADDRRYGRLERKHSLQEPKPGSRAGFFQRNHSSSGRVSAPPSERYLVRPRAIRPMDRPLPAIPHSRLELTNYQDYLEDGEERWGGEDMDRLGKAVYPATEHSEHSTQAGLYENEDASRLILKSVSAQVKITRQPIVKQNQRAPLVGRPLKYPSPESSRKSADYADSSCTPNSSQKSEFSPSSSKSGEYYLHSPRNSGSPNERDLDDAREERIYENEAQTERIYDETPPSPSSRDHEPCQSPSSKASKHSPKEWLERKGTPTRPRNSSSNSSPGSKNSTRRTCNDESPHSRQRHGEDTVVRGEDRSMVQRFSSPASSRSKTLIASSSSPVSPISSISSISPGGRGSTSCSRRSQPNDQILIASPKRDVAYDSRLSRPSKESLPRRCDLESPVPMINSPRRLPGVAPLESPSRDPHGNQESSASKVVKSTAEESATISAFCNDIARPEPIYGHRMQQRVPARRNVSESLSQIKAEREDGSQLSTLPHPRREASPRRDLEDRVAWVQGRACSTPKSPEKRSDTAGQGRGGGTRTQVQANVPEFPDLRSKELNRHRQQQQHDDETRRLTVPRMAQSPSLPSIVSQDKVYMTASARQRDPSHEQRSHQRLQQEQLQQDQKLRQHDRLEQGRFVEDPMYVQRVAEPLYGQRSIAGSGPLSPSKRETRQHLEAFYWQQKALEAHRRSASSPVNSSLRQTGRKIDLPEVREAVYWQQLKKLDEEQQKRIYEQNRLEESSSCWKRGQTSPTGRSVASSNASSNTSSRATPRNPMVIDTSMSSSIVCTDSPSYWDGNFHRSKINSTGKPPVMLTQKGQNQPVLIVRPQQAMRERRDMPAKPLDSRDPQRQETQRSKSVSPHLHGCEDQMSDTVDKTVLPPPPPPPMPPPLPPPLPPPPIFKRGSLISGDSVEYGSTGGTKRVSFSNQSTSGADVSIGSWPTKHGSAPEPPTRRHRSEDSTSDTDSVFSHRDHRDAKQYPESEYDADRPLPPLPNIPNLSNLQPRPGDIYSPTTCVVGRWPSTGNENAIVAGVTTEEAQRISRRNEEEWNPDGKGRQSNDTGGSVRGESETGSNEVPTGRRGGGGGGGGVGSGIGGGGGVLGVGTGNVNAGGASGGRSTSGGSGRSRDEPRRHTLGGDHQPSLHHQQFNAAQQLHPLHPHHLPPPHGQYGTPPTRHTTMDLEMGTKSRQRKSPLPRGYPPPSSTMLFDDDPGIMSEVETSSTGFRRGGKQRSSLPVVRTPSKTLERPLGLVFLQYRNETKRALLPNEITSIDTVKALFVRSFPKQLTMEYLDSPHVKVYIHDSNKDMFYELEDLRSHLRDIRDRSVLRLFESTDGVTGMPGPLGVPGGGTGLPPHWEDQSYFSEPEFDSEYQHQHIHKSKTAKNSTSGSSGYYSSTLPRGGPLLRAYSPAASSVVAVPNATPTQPKSLTAPDRLHGESGYMSSPERGGGVASGTGRYPTGPYSAGSSYEDPYYSQYSGTVTPVIDEEARMRVEHMERQLANLTGLVQKALTHAPHTSPSPRDYLQVPAGRDPYARAAERDRHKPTPPPKPAALVAGQYVYRDLSLTPEMYNQLRGLQKKAKDLRQEVRNLRRMSQTQAHTVRETIRDTFITIRAMLLSGGDAAWSAGDAEKVRLSREEDLYKQEMIRLEKDLTELESTVEELRGNVINRKTRVNMSDVENMALILSKSSKTVADLKVRFPNLQEGMKGLLSSEMEKVVREEKFLKEEPERLESALRRCKKLTGTLVTLKRLASVQEQRLPNATSVDAEETPPITPTSAQHSKAAAPVPAERTVVGSASVVGGGSHPHESSTTHQQRPENALDALLDELQTFSRPSSQLGQISGLVGTISHQGGSSTLLSELGRSASRDTPVTTTTATAVTTTATGGTAAVASNTLGRAPCISDIGRKGSVDSSSSIAGVGGGGVSSGGALTIGTVAGIPGAQVTGGTLRRLHSYPSSSDTDTSPPIARLQVSLQEQPSLPVLPQGFLPGQKPPVPERNAELLQLASARRVPPPPPPRTSSRSPLASPTSPQLPPRNHACNLQPGNATLRRPAVRTTTSLHACKEGKPPMALPPDALTAVPTLEPATGLHNSSSSSSQSSALLSTSNSSSCESVNSQEGLQSKRGRQEQLEQRHQELLRKQKALQEQYARLQQLQRNAAGLTTVPPAPPDLLKKTGSESNLLAKMGLGLSAASSGSLTSLAAGQPKLTSQEPNAENHRPRQEEPTARQIGQFTAANASVTAANLAATTATNAITTTTTTIGATTATTAIAITSTTTTSCNYTMVTSTTAPTGTNETNDVRLNTGGASTSVTTSTVSTITGTNATTTTTTTTTTTSKIYETDIL